MKIHQRLYEYINDHNISIKEISARTGISKKRLDKIFLKEECDMALDEYIAVCDAIDVALDYFERAN